MAEQDDHRQDKVAYFVLYGIHSEYVSGKPLNRGFYWVGTH